MIAKTAADWSQSLIDHMPQGFALDLDEGGLFRRLFEGLAIELARFDALCDDLLDELDPSTTVQFISDVERMLALPRACQTPPTILEQRRAVVLAVLTRNRNLAPNTLIEIAALYGFTITIAEHAAPDAASTWFQYDVTTSAAIEIVPFTSGGSVANDPLGAITQLDLDCILTEIEPAWAEHIFL
jgi:uncharacterized protein YmfQ (DUF2313 family)